MDHSFKPSSALRHSPCWALLILQQTAKIGDMHSRPSKAHIARIPRSTVIGSMLCPPTYYRATGGWGSGNTPKATARPNRHFDSARAGGRASQRVTDLVRRRCWHRTADQAVSRSSLHQSMAAGAGAGAALGGTSRTGQARQVWRNSLEIGGEKT